jgi:hypothetical protein
MRSASLQRSRDNAVRVLQELAAATGKPRFTRRSLSLRQHGRTGFPGAIRSRQASLELSCSPARSALLPEVHTPPPAPRKSNWEVIEHFSSSSGSLTRGSKGAQSANLVAVSPCLHARNYGLLDHLPSKTQRLLQGQPEDRFFLRGTISTCGLLEDRISRIILKWIFDLFMLFNFENNCLILVCLFSC